MSGGHGAPADHPSPEILIAFLEQRFVALEFSVVQRGQHHGRELTEHEVVLEKAAIPAPVQKALSAPILILSAHGASPE